MVLIQENKNRIDTFEELESLLTRIYDFETQLEISMEWEAYYVTNNNDYRETLFSIIHDLEKHIAILKKLINNLDGFEIDCSSRIKKYIDKRVDFDGLSEEVTALKLIKNKSFVHDLYQKAHEFSDDNLVKHIWKGDNFDDYYNTLNWLAEQKNEQIKLLSPYAGQVERIA